MVEDQQTHNLPKSAEGLALVAGLHGLDGSEALFDLLRPHVERTATIYDGLIGSETSGTLSKDPVKLGEQMEAMGFPDATAPVARVAHWRGGTVRALRSKIGRAHVGNPVTNAQLVCRLLLEK